MASALTDKELERALHELKSCTMPTMETIGIRCARRVNTTIFKQGLAALKGTAMSVLQGWISSNQFL